MTNENTKTDFDLNADAVGRASGDDAGSVLGALLETPGINLVHEYTMSQAPAAPTPSAPASPGGMGMGGAVPRKAATTQGAEGAEIPADNSPVVSEYEIFQNDYNAVAFFLSRQDSADMAGDEGPYWFMIEDDKNIIAGNESGQAFFPDVKPEVINVIKDRGVILLIEFENQKPLRCTPCYLKV